jgi:hypothetical protein
LLGYGYFVRCNHGNCYSVSKPIATFQRCLRNKELEIILKEKETSRTNKGTVFISGTGLEAAAVSAAWLL